MAGKILETYFILAVLVTYCVDGADPADPFCPQGWQFYLKGNKCIKVIDVVKTWNDARSYCQQKGGDLLTVFDDSTQNLIQGLLDAQQASYWIGLRYNSVRDDFIWTDDTALNDFQKWHEGKPLTKEINSCVRLMDNAERKWKDTVCTRQNPFICERDTLEHSTCDNSWRQWYGFGKCIKFINKWKYFTRARSYCRGQGGDLMKIPDKRTNDFVVQEKIAAKYSTVWIGLSWSKMTGWTWTDGTPLTNFSNWAPNQRKGSVQISGSSSQWKTDGRSREFFLCEKTLAVSKIKTKCPRNWAAYPLTKKCVRSFHEKKTWNDARRYCQYRGGDLVTVSKEKGYNNFIINTLQERNSNGFYWIGGAVYPVAYAIEWVDKMAVAKFSNWGQDQPNRGDRKKCVQIFTIQNNKWFDYDCEDETDFICEQSMEITARACPADWHMYSNLCLRSFDNKKSWSDARSHCKQEGGDLVTIPDYATNELVLNEAKTTGNNNFWIGLTNVGHEQQFKWVDNTSLDSFDNWGIQQSTHKTGLDCVQLHAYKDHKWYQARCDQKVDYICQQPSFTDQLKCPVGWHLSVQSRSCIRWVELEKNFTDARMFCQNNGNGADLVKDTQASMTRLFNAVLPGSKKWWIGLNSMNGTYRWIDNTSLSYTTKRSLQTCVYADSLQNFKWKNSKCSDKHHFICEIQIPDTPPTIEPTTTTKPKTATLTIPSTPNSQAKSNKEGDDDGLSGGNKAGIAIGCICVVTVAIVAALLLLRRAGKLSWPKSNSDNSRNRHIDYKL